VSVCVSQITKKKITTFTQKHSQRHILDMLRVLFNVLCAFAVSSLRERSYLRTVKDEPNGPGQGESTKALACSECEALKQHITTSSRDACTCYATDINGTFQSDATKNAVTQNFSTSEDRDEDTGAATHQSSTVETNTGMERLPEHWHWHCRQVTAEDTWEQCPPVE